MSIFLRQHLELLSENSVQASDLSCEECDRLRTRLELMKGRSDAVDTMSLEELNDLEKQLNQGLERLQDARTRIVIEDRQCIVCQDRNKSICFVDGCDQCMLAGLPTLPEFEFKSV